MITLNALLYWASITTVTKVTSGSACLCAIEVAHDVIRVIRTVPATSAMISLSTCLTGIVTLQLGQQYEIVQFIHDVSLLIIPIRLDDKSITRFVIDSILDILDLDCDRP